MPVALRLIGLLVVGLGLAGCADDACLPAPADDATPPGLRLEAAYTDAATGRQTTLALTADDSARTATARASEPVLLRFTADDAEGLRRLYPALTVQQTVGGGVRHESMRIAPVAADCPRPTLSAERTVPGAGKRQTLLVSAAAENWAGARRAAPNLTVRME